MHARARLWLAVAILAWSLTAGAQADGLGNENAPPQEICGTCHGLNGVSRMAKFPKLAGQPAAYIEKQIRDFRAGRRQNDGGQMAAIVTEISEPQIAEVAKYFAALPPPEADVQPLDPAARSRAERLFNTGDARADLAPCTACHGLRGLAKAATPAPHLSAQHEAYIVKQLADFRSGARANDTDSDMQAIARKLSEDDIAALARYLTAQPRN